MFSIWPLLPVSIAEMPSIMMLFCPRPPRRVPPADAPVPTTPGVKAVRLVKLLREIGRFVICASAGDEASISASSRPAPAESPLRSIFPPATDATDYMATIERSGQGVKSKNSISSWRCASATLRLCAVASRVSIFRKTTTYLATETQRHGEEHVSGSALDAAPRSGGRGVPTANERRLDRGSVVRLRSARLTARPAVQAARVERLCVSVSPWLVQINTSA